MKNEIFSETGTPYILIVDDIGANLKLLSQILKDEGYSVRPVTSGEMALKVAEMETPGLILLDIMMPGMSGYKVCRQLKENPVLKDVPVIFVSALNDSYDIVKALNLGGVDYITKPFKTEEVIARVNTHFKLHQQSIELQKQKKELKELNETKDKFFSIVAHDLRGPFNGFLGFTQLLAEQYSGLDQSKIQKMAVAMRDSAASLFRLLENLLEWSRMQKGLIGFNPDLTNLVSVVSGIMRPVMDSARKKEIAISVEIPSGMVVFADEYMLASIIRNLASNAVKFTRKGGNIAISAATAPDNFVEITVADNGIGMNGTMVDGLFRLDVKTNREGTDGEPSSGLGLILCKDFIEKHGGKIWAESEKGKGSTFRFTLPGQK